MRISQIVAVFIVLVMVITLSPQVSFTSSESWYETSVTVTIPPGGEVEVGFVDGKLVAMGNLDDTFGILSKTPDWLKADLIENLSSLSKSAARLSDGAFVQTCTILPEEIEVIVISGHGEKQSVLKSSNMEFLDIIPENIDKYSRLTFADIDYDDNSDLIVCPNNGGWYWLAGPTFAIPHKGETTENNWSRKKLYPLTNPEKPNIVKPVPLEKGLSYLDESGEIVELQTKDFLFELPDTFGSVSSNKLLFVDSDNDIRYFRMINGKSVGFSADSITLLPNFDDETHMCLSDNILYVGTLEGELIICKPDEQGNFVISDEIIDLPFGRNLCPQIADINDDNKKDFIWSDSNGIFVSYGPDWTTTEKLDLWTESIIAVGDVTGDGKADIVTIENNELVIHKAPTFEEAGIKFELEFGKHLYPSVGDANGDRKNDIVVGNEDGKLTALLAPDWHETDILASIDIGDFSYPYLDDFDGDGRDDLVVSNVLGETYSYKAMPDGWQEYQSWSFIPGYPYYSVSDYYKRYYRESPLLYWDDDSESVSKYVKLLQTCPSNHFDEIAFCIAHTPANVLRTMADMGQENILSRNAKMIYEVAPELGYASLKEYDNFTTCVYETEKGSVELPYMDYYWYVVHPRMLFELPLAVDASWWEKSFEDYDIEQKAWWTHRTSSEEFYEGENRAFWREGLIEDDSFGETVVSAVKGSATLTDAILKTHGLLAHGKENPHNIFGYLTNDLYPWHIFKKHYGSCGEQSIMFAAVAKTVLIPNYIVINHGEDHQWNEVWLPKGWCQFDLNFKEPLDDGRYYENIWKKTVSSVWGWRGDDMFFPTTKTVHNKKYEDKEYLSDSGYTDTASVYIKILDIRENPVEGAMVFARSGWGSRNGIAIWDYTNSDGVCHMDLGYEPYYIIDCISPYGATGLSRLVVKEGEEYNITLHVPGEAPLPPIQLQNPSEIIGDVKVQVDMVKEYLRPPNRITSFGYRLGSYLSDNYGYRGVKDYKHPAIETSSKINLRSHNYQIKAHSIFGISENETFTLSNETNLSWKKITLTSRVELDDFKINIGLPKETINVKSGEALKLEFIPTAPSPIVSLEWSWDKNTWFKLNDEHIVETGTGGPPSPGERTIFVRVGALFQDGVETETSSVKVNIEPTNEFKNQPVHQDPRDPLESVSWKFGPFTIPDGLDYFLITTSSITSSLDLDIFLYHDKNGNGDISEKDERISSSTAPASDEKILLKDPESGPYYILCQGCRCPDENSKFSIKFSSIPSW